MVSKYAALAARRLCWPAVYESSSSCDAIVAHTAGMVACSSRVIVAATTEKLGARGHWQIAGLDEIDDLVLTTSAPPALAARFLAAGIAVHPTPP